MRNSPYFKHDATAFFNEKLMELVHLEGLKGYGAYWLILECLRTQVGFRASFSILKTLSYRSRTKPAFLKHIIEDFGLFVVEQDFFYSRGLQSRLMVLLERQNALETAQKSVNGELNLLFDNSLPAVNAREEEKRREERESF